MRKFLKALGVAAFLSVFTLGTAFAAVVPQATVVENTVAGGMDAAGEVSGTITVAPFTTLSIFWGGTYSAANRFELQEELGSPGSGAFRKVLRLDTNTANSDARTTYLTGPNRSAYRVAMTVAGTGDVLVKMTNASLTPNDFTDFREYLRFFTDFDTQTTAVDAAHFLAQSEGAGTAFAVLVTVEEGGTDGISDSNADGTDTQTLCTIVTTDKAGLVSDGWMSFEARFRVNEVGIEVELGAGYVDAVCDGDSGDTPATASAQELTVVGYTDVAVLLTDGGATQVLNVTPFSVNAGVEQHDIDTANTSHFYDTGIPIVDDQYIIFRVEIDASGDVFYYVDGALVFAEFTGVNTTATLAPQVWVGSDGAGTTTPTMVIDWWLSTITRPIDAT